MADDKDFYDESKFPDVALGDVVRLKEPYKKGYGKKVVLYRYGIVVEVLQVTPRGKVRNVSLHLYVSIGQEAGQNIGQDGERERLPDEGDLQAPRMCHDWS